MDWVELSGPTGAVSGTGMLSRRLRSSAFDIAFISGQVKSWPAFHLHCPCEKLANCCHCGGVLPLRHAVAGMSNIFNFRFQSTEKAKMCWQLPKAAKQECLH